MNNQDLPENKPSVSDGSSGSNQRPLIPPETILKDYTDSAHKFLNLDSEGIDRTIKQLGTMPSYQSYDLEIWAWVVYFDIKATPTNGDGKSFSGKAGGLSGLVGGKAWGTLYTDDVLTLFENTKSFMFTAYGGVYEALYFYDKDHNLLGYIQAGGVTIAVGMAGGTGHWS
ncbi:VapA/VapB family virulence-associated protein [Pantoea sp. CCBC3-3-1]|uniref:VapA/VapB family virulence-associated protein n=1 Tax=Pantoea sp. CCBC3-3-1 TaxID=2490851 RepID=UPI00143D1E9C|nr:VapA/VapB family virulence-associated protein [Pantoea sp. CCBC3-3-1]